MTLETVLAYGSFGKGSVSRMEAALDGSERYVSGMEKGITIRTGEAKALKIAREFLLARGHARNGEDMFDIDEKIKVAHRKLAGQYAGVVRMKDAGILQFNIRGIYAELDMNDGRNELAAFKERRLAAHGSEAKIKRIEPDRLVRL